MFEAAPDIKPLGVGINLLPHGMRELAELGLQDALTRVAVETQRAVLLQPLRAVHLQGAARPPRGLRLAAAFDPPRRPAPGAARGGAQAAWAPMRSCSDTQMRVDRPGPGAVDPAFDRRQFRRRAAASSAATASIRRCASSCFPARARRLPRHQHVARRDARAALPERRQHGRGRLADSRQDGDLPDPPTTLDGRGRPAHQLGRGDPVAAQRDAGLDLPAAGSADFYPAFESWKFDWLDSRR